MYKITLNDFFVIMSHNISKNQFYHEIEIEFCIDDSDIYKNCWLGKLLDKDTKKELFWYGLVQDGSEAYDFASFEEFLNAKVFLGKSIREIWSSISLISIDASDVQERLLFYLGL